MGQGRTFEAASSGVAALACGMTMQRLRQPVGLGYIVCGGVLGPSGPGPVEARAFVEVSAELGVLVLSFPVAMAMGSVPAKVARAAETVARSPSCAMRRGSDGRNGELRR